MRLSEKQEATVKNALHHSIGFLDKTDADKVRAMLDKDFEPSDISILLLAMMDVAYLDEWRDNKVEERREKAVQTVKNLINKYQLA